ncbi:MAG TPA: DUF4386 domain-containing protein [Dactylosporangium sp.]|nr:DUF4386 domain-containing protein [Dactylosporangium sp.]
MHRTTARVTGALFLTATVAGVISVPLIAPDNGPHARQAGALLVLVMAGAIALIPTTLFPVLRRYGEGRALGYVAARLLEVVMLLPAAAGPLIAVAAPSPPVEALVRTEEHWGQPASALFFCLGAVLFYSLVWRARLVPRWLSGWALVAIAPYVAGAVIVLFGVVDPASPVNSAMYAPLALNELVLAVWLLARGFTVRAAAEVPQRPAPVPQGV